MNGWQPIKSAPLNEPVWVYGYNIYGQSSPSGPYKHYETTVCEIDSTGDCLDLFQPDTDQVCGRRIKHPLFWQRFDRPEPPTAVEAASPATLREWHRAEGNTIVGGEESATSAAK
jgi:hypothetical protein